LDGIKDEIKDLCDIRIDKDGTWYYRGAEMYRKDIVQYLYGYIKKDTDGDYYIELSDYDRCKIDVEDTAFIVRSAERVQSDNKQQSETIQIHLSDESSEELCLDSLSISGENVLYCQVKGNEFKARFSRKSYYQIINDVEYDEINTKFFLKLNGHRYFIEESENH
jgi:uncharacterized protein